MARLLVTRPIEQAEPLADRLRAQGHQVLVEPMLRVRFLEAALPSLDGVQALLLTSRNGVRALAQATDRRDIRVLAVGDATADEARAAGFEQVESADGDASALVDHATRALRPEDGAVLHISGFDVAVDAAAELAARGFQADRAVLYEADVADALSPAAHQALSEQSIDAVLFHSPRAAKTFGQLVDDAGLNLRLRSVTALALSEQVADAIRHLDWQSIRVAAQPNEAALLALLDTSVAAAPTPPAAAPRRGWGVSGLLAAAVVGLIAGGVAAYGVTRWLPAPASPAAAVDTGALERRLAELEAKVGAVRLPTAEIDALTRRISALEARPAPADPAPRLDELAARVAQVEGRPAVAGGGGESAAQIEELDRRIAALTERVAGLGPREEAPSDLPERLAAVERQAKAVADRLAAAAPPAGEALRVALVLGVGELSEQALSGRPYADALSQVESLLGADRALAEPLKPNAAPGIPTVTALRRDFDDVARRVVEAAAGEGDHWLDHVRGRLAALFVLRRTGEVPGEAPDAVVARAEARLQNGDLAAAVAEIGKLSGRPAEAAADWRRRAETRLEAEKALAALKRRTFELARAGLK